MKSERRRPNRWVEEYPVATLLTVFGVGLGVGVVVGHAFYESLVGMVREESLSERIGCQARQALKHALPERVGRHFS